jgi:hypothetical protein
MMEYISSIRLSRISRASIYTRSRGQADRDTLRARPFAFLLRRRAVRPGDHADLRRLYVLSLPVGPAAASCGSRSAPAPENLKARIASSE